MKRYCCIGAGVLLIALFCLWWREWVRDREPTPVIANPPVQQRPVAPPPIPSASVAASAKQEQPSSEVPVGTSRQSLLALPPGTVIPLDIVWEADAEKLQLSPALVAALNEMCGQFRETLTTRMAQVAEISAPAGNKREILVMLPTDEAAEFRRRFNDQLDALVPETIARQPEFPWFRKTLEARLMDFGFWPQKMIIEGEMGSLSDAKIVSVTIHTEHLGDSAATDRRWGGGWTTTGPGNWDVASFKLKYGALAARIFDPAR
jgi:hypothetical protein